MRVSPLIFLTAISLSFASGATVFQDGFEVEPLGSQWSASGSNDGRAQIRQDHSPAGGARHLILDDGVSDALFSVAEATLALELANKKNVVLSFKAKSLGNEPHTPPTGNFTSSRNYDGVAISADGGTTWRSVQSLAGVATAWESFSVTLDGAVSALGGRFRANFRIRFSEYDNASAPVDGLAIDDVSVTADDDQRAVLELPGTLTEGSGQQIGYVLLAYAPVEPLTVSFTSSPAGQMILPASVVIAAGETYASFEFSVANDALVNLNRAVTVTPVAPPEVTVTAASVLVLDDETAPTATLLLPATLTEGTTPTNNASVSLNFPASAPITFALSANPASQLTVPATVTVPAGQTQIVFTVVAVNDTQLDGSVPVTVTASAPPLAVATAQTTTLDNEIPALSLTLPATMLEGTAGTGTATISGPLQVPLDVNLSSSATATLTVPATATIPAGQTSVSFALTAINDALVNLTRSVTITASGTGATATTGNLSVLDDEAPPVATLTLPVQLTEGTSASNNATLALSFAPAVALTVTLSASPGGELSIPSSVTVPAGQTQVIFTAQAVNDSKIDGNILVTVSASASGIASVTAQATAVDNETRVLALTLPTALQEGTTGSATANIPGTLTTPLDVALSNSNASVLTVPATVTIPAGQTQVTFNVTAIENDLREGTKTVNLGAAAATFTSASRSLLVRDNDVAGYRFATLTDIVNANNPLSITVSAVDMEGNVISGFAGSVNLHVVLPGGSTQPVTPATALLTGTTGWTGSVTLPVVSAAPLRLRATDASGNTGDSNAFDIMRVLTLTTADLLWDAARSRIYASVPATAGGSYANQVVTIDPATLQITGSVTTNQDPGQIVMTSGGEYLYVALNGNGTIAKINPATMTVLSTFAVGTDPSYGTLYAADLCPVTGQPNVLVVSQYRKSVSPAHNGVAAYDNGVIRALKTQDHTGSNVIEPSADPTIFFGYNTESTEYGFRRLQLGTSGMTQLEVNTSLINGFSNDLRSEGNRVFSNSGVAVDGALMKRLGTFPVAGLVRPDLSANRVYFLEQQSTYSTSYDKTGAYDPATFSTIRRLTLPAVVTSPGSFIRWGLNGLAFRTANTVNLIGSSQLVPSDPPANLAVTVQASPNPVSSGAPLTYTIQLTNLGPNIARNTLLNATLSDSQTISIVTASSSAPSVAGLVVSLPVGDLASGSNVTLTITTIPQSAGSLTCTASATSNAVDPDFTNNIGFKLVSVGFQSVVDVVNQLRLTANNLIYDPTRNLLWASIPSTVEAPLGKSIVSINPTTGLISDPLPLNANPFAQSMALSTNGRYLYVGLTDVPEVHRIDLAAAGYPSARIPLGNSQWGSANYAEDIEPLDGDGTSFLMAGSDDHAAAVYDGSVRRGNRTGIYSVDRIERSGTAGTFIGYNSYTSGFGLTRLAVTSAGVSESQNVSNVVSGYYVDIRTAGNLLLSSSGLLVDNSNLTLKASLGLTGRPCVDGPNQRAYLVNGNGLRAYNVMAGSATGTLTLPTTATGDWAQTCVRSGLDGFAILGNDGKIYIARWSATIPAGLDQNNDGIADAWAAANFGTLAVNPAGDGDSDGLAAALEYLFVTSPQQTSANPLQFSTANVGGQQVLHVTFPRRAGLAAGSYGYEMSQVLGTWNPVLNATETVLSTQTVGGVQIELVDAAIPCPSWGSGFVRLIWTHP